VRVLIALVLLAAACGSAPYPAGHTCVSSAECGDGLLCDYGVTPHVCAGMSSASTDLAVMMMTPADASMPTTD
jgi:hypothetical protein